MWGGDEERGVEKEPDTEQTKLLTDGGTKELGLGEPKVREASLDEHLVADCPGCLDPMLLGDVWYELILEDDYDVPECPDCEPEEWRDGADPMLDGVEFWALAGDVIDVDGEEGSA